MSRSNLSRAAALAVFFVVFLSAVAACDDPLAADVSGSGTLVAWLSGLDFHATIGGELRLTGELLVGGEAVPFFAEGTLCGFGVRGIVTLISEGWIGYAAAGATATDEPIEIRGLLHARWKGLIPIQIGDVLVGEQLTIVDFRGEERSFVGEFSGTVEGGLAPSERPGTIQLSGSGTFHLTGAPGSFPGSIPLDHPDLPAEFLQYLSGLGIGI